MKGNKLNYYYIINEKKEKSKNFFWYNKLRFVNTTIILRNKMVKKFIANYIFIV